MSANRILVLGANGQLGRALRAEFPNATFWGRNECDLSDIDSISRIPWDSIDVLINAAAYTAVDAAESDEGSVAAYAINATAVEKLAEFAKLNDVLLVHVSTDYVFDGNSHVPYSEVDPVNPLGVYAKSKAAGDRAVEQIPRHFILRTSWVIGDGNNFVHTMSSLADRGIEPAVVNDQIGRLTFTEDLAAGIKHLLTSGAAFGAYNLSNEGPQSSWFDIARRVYDLTGHDSLAVTGVSTEDYFRGKAGIAPRPLWSMLDLSKIQATGFTPASWDQRLAEYLA